MTILTRTLLDDMGIHVSEECFRDFYLLFEAELNERVVDEILLELSPEQAREMALLLQPGDKNVARRLTEYVPDIDAIVSNEIDILIGQIAQAGRNY